MRVIPLNRQKREHVATLDNEVRIADVTESVHNPCTVLYGRADSEEVNKGPQLKGRRDKKRPPLAQGPSDHGRKPMAGYITAVPTQRSE